MKPTPHIFFIRTSPLGIQAGGSELRNGLLQLFEYSGLADGPRARVSFQPTVSRLFLKHPPRTAQQAALTIKQLARALCVPHHLCFTRGCSATASVSTSQLTQVSRTTLLMETHPSFSTQKEPIVSSFPLPAPGLAVFMEGRGMTPPYQHPYTTLRALKDKNLLPPNASAARWGKLLRAELPAQPRWPWHNSTTCLIHTTQVIKQTDAPPPSWRITRLGTEAEIRRKGPSQLHAGADTTKAGSWAISARWSSSAAVKRKKNSRHFPCRYFLITTSWPKHLISHCLYAF